MRRQEAPIAILAMGPANQLWPHTAIAIPVLKTVNGSKPNKTFIQGTLYNIGSTEVNCNANIATVAPLDTAQVSWMRVTIHEAEALKGNAVFL